jgi:hypothetical protein
MDTVAVTVEFQGADWTPRLGQSLKPVARIPLLLHMDLDLKAEGGRQP